MFGFRNSSSYSVHLFIVGSHISWWAIVVPVCLVLGAIALLVFVKYTSKKRAPTTPTGGDINLSYLSESQQYRLESHQPEAGLPPAYGTVGAGPDLIPTDEVRRDAPDLVATNEMTGNRQDFTLNKFSYSNDSIDGLPSYEEAKASMAVDKDDSEEGLPSYDSIADTLSDDAMSAACNRDDLRLRRSSSCTPNPPANLF